MKVRVLAVGGVKGPLRTLAEDYRTRAGHYWRIEVEEVSVPKRSSPEVEGDRILRRLAPTDYVVALTREGTPISSTGFASLLEESAVRSRSSVVFLIGGASGLHEHVLEKAHRKISLGSITIPHELARVALLEQLYRAGTIVRGEPYHKGPTRR